MLVSKNKTPTPNACFLYSRTSIISSALSALGKLPPPNNKLINRAQQLRLQYKFPLLVLLRRLVRLVVLPSHRLVTLPAHDVPYEMPARRHIAFCGFRLRDIHDSVEEVGFAVLAAEVL